VTPGPLGPLRARAAEARAVLETCRIASSAYGISLPRAARRMARVHFGQGFAHDEALPLGLLDPAMPEAELDRYASKRRLMQYTKALNPRPMSALTEDKALFNRFATAAGLPVATLHAVHHRGATGWARGGRPLRGPADWTRLIAHDLPDEFVVKPARGYWGIGVRVLRREDDGLRDVATEALTTADALIRDMDRHPEFDVWVLEERLLTHPGLAPVAVGEALHTIRASTLVARDGTVDLLAANMKLASSGRVADNWSEGRYGTILANVDVRSGALHDGCEVTINTAGWTRVDAHPVTGTPLPGWPIPHWDDILALLERAARAFLPLRAIGWDVALTTRGPVLVEANFSWDPPNPSPDTRGLMNALADA